MMPRRLLQPELLETRQLLAADLMAADLMAGHEEFCGTCWTEPTLRSPEFDYRVFRSSADFIGPKLPEHDVDVTKWIARLTKVATESIRTPEQLSFSFGFNPENLRVDRGLGGNELVLLESILPKSETESILANHPLIDRFERATPIFGQVVPNDPAFPRMDGLRLIKAEQAWDAVLGKNITVGDSNVVVSVMDTGIDLSHPDLYLNVWLNQGEIPDSLTNVLEDIDSDGLITFYDLNHSQNQLWVSDLNDNGYIDAKDLLADPRWEDGVDTDGNRYRDDLVGWDFVDGDNDPSDEQPNGHGTHVAGIIGATGDNGREVVGVNWRTSLLAARVLDQTKTGNSAAAAEAVRYARVLRERGTANIRVTNNSFVSTFSQALEEEIEEAYDADILTVAAAGNGDIFNEGINIDFLPRYPASYSSDGVISVGALGEDGTDLASFSNFGSCSVVECSVDIAAPGVGIRSTGINATKNGTSMAAPFVAGVAGLLFSIKPDATADEVKAAILGSAESLPALSGLVATGRLNALAAIEAIQEPPSATLLSAGTISVATNQPLEIKVRYATESGSNGVDVASLGAGDITVSRDDFSNSQIDVELTDVCWEVSPGSCLDLPIPEFEAPTDVIVATYRLSVPSEYSNLGYGEKWDAIHNGNYVITVAEDEVTNRDGIGNRERMLTRPNAEYSFRVQIESDDVFIVSDATELRSRIIAAGTNPTTIVVLDGDYQLNSPSSVDDIGGDLDIKSEVTILGAGEEFTEIIGPSNDRVFEVYPSGSLQLVGVNVTGGTSDEGGGLRNLGVAKIVDSRISENVGRLAGGGIWNSGVLEITESTIDRNREPDRSGRGGGGIFNQGTLLIERSTISRNESESNSIISDRGGGGLLQAANPSGDQASTVLINTTISENQSSSDGGGVYVLGGSLDASFVTIARNESKTGRGGGINFGNTTVQLRNSIVVPNTAETDNNVAGQIAPSTANSNLIDDPGVVLTPLGNYGGSTETHLLLSHHDVTTLSMTTSTDQRGFPRGAINSAAPITPGATQKHFVELRGTIFHDVDGDGEKDASDNALNGWTVYVDVNENGRFDTGEPLSTTNQEREYVILGVDPEPGTATVRLAPREGYVETTPILLDSRAADDVGEISTVVTQTERIQPVFHLDFAQQEIQDVSSARLPIYVGQFVSARPGQGPRLENGMQLSAGEWQGIYDENENEIRIFDHPILDDVSQSAGAIVTWVNVANDEEWNSIVIPDRQSEFQPFQGIEFDVAGDERGVFGSVQGWGTNVFGPNHKSSGGTGIETGETPAGIWHHVAMTWDEQGNHTIFVNGVPGRTYEGVGEDRSFGTNNLGDWSIGGNTWPNNNGDPQAGSEANARMLHGKLADFAIFNQELTSETINDLMRSGVAPPIEKVFHLDFSKPASQLADISDYEMEIRVGALMQTKSGGGPTLESGETLDSGFWLDYDDDEAHIDILDNSVLDEVSRSAGSITTWIKVADDRDWNSIVKTQCPQGVSEPCQQFGETRGIELQTDRSLVGGVFGSPQGWARQAFGPLPERQGASGTETPTDVWTHVAMTWNDLGDHTIYVNGIAGGRELGVGIEAFGLNDTGDWSIGADRLDEHVPANESCNDNTISNCRRLHGELADFAIFQGELDRQMINDIIRKGVPRPLEPLFYLDFASEEIQDQSLSRLIIEVGDAISTDPDGGPTLRGGMQLAAGVWPGVDSEQNQILIRDNLTLDQVSQGSGAIATWINVEDEQQWNSIAKTICPNHAEPCAEFGPFRGVELQANSRSGVFGSVQGYRFPSFGPSGGSLEPGSSETPSGEWVHIAYTWDDFGKQTIYVNGIPGAVEDRFPGNSFGINDPGDWIIGGDMLEGDVSASTDPNGRRLTGKLADFAIFDSELSLSEIESIMTFGIRSTQRGGNISPSIQEFARFGKTPSIVGERVVFEDHLGRINSVESNREPVTLVGLADSAAPAADGLSIAFDGLNVAYSAMTPSSSGGQSAIFLVDPFGQGLKVVDESTRVNQERLFENKSLRVYSTANGEVVFGAIENDRTNGAGRLTIRGGNTTGIFVGAPTEVVPVVRTGEPVPGRNATFSEFGEVVLDLDENTIVFEAGFVESGSDEESFGVFEERPGSRRTLLNEETRLPNGETLIAVKSFDYSLGDLVFHGIGSVSEGVFWLRQDRSRNQPLRIADTGTTIPNDSGTFETFGRVVYDKGNAVFVGRGRSSETASKLGLSEQLGIYASLNGQLERVVDLQHHDQPAAFGGRRPVDFAIGPQALSGDSVVFYAAFADGTEGVFSAVFESDSVHVVELRPGAAIDRLDFGRLPQSGSIGGEVYIELNGDNELDLQSESGNFTYGINVKLIDADTGNVLRETTTGPSGRYEFKSIPTLRAYRVQVESEAREIPLVVPDNIPSELTEDNFLTVSLTALRPSQEFFLEASETKTVHFPLAESVTQEADVGDISIRVVDEDGEPVDGRFVVYVDENENGIFDSLDTEFDLNGQAFQKGRLSLDKQTVRFAFGSVAENDRFDIVEPISLRGREKDLPKTAEIPTSIVTGDFNNDQLPDLLITDYENNSLVYVTDYANNVAGTANPRFGLGGTGPVSMLSHDFNGDGNLDVVIANGLSYSVSVMLGDGHGSFQLVRIVELTGRPEGLAIRNGKSLGDIVVSVTGRENGLALLSNQGTIGTSWLGFGATSFIRMDQQPAGIASGRFDSDQVDDIVITSPNSNSLYVLLSSTNDQLHLIGEPVGSRPVEIVAGHFDDDDLLDVAVASVAKPMISVLYGTANSILSSPQDTELIIPATSIAAADLDGDEDADLVVAQAGFGQLGLKLLINGSDGFSVSSLQGAGAFPDELAVLSVATSMSSSSGAIDFVLSNSETGDITMIENEIVRGEHIVELSRQQSAQEVVFVLRDLEGDDRIPGDANLDNIVDFADFLVVATNITKQFDRWEDGDFDGSGIVDFADFLILSANFGRRR